MVARSIVVTQQPLWGILLVIVLIVVAASVIGAIVWVRSSAPAPVPAPVPNPSPGPPGPPGPPAPRPPPRPRPQPQPRPEPRPPRPQPGGCCDASAQKCALCLDRQQGLDSSDSAGHFANMTWCSRNCDTGPRTQNLLF